MKRTIILGLMLAMIMSLSVFSVAGAAVEVDKVPVQDASVLETGTYRVSVSNGEGMGFFVINDEAGEPIDYVIIQNSDYGYIYFDKEYHDKGYSYDIQNVSFEFVAEEDLGFSGYHVFELVKGRRDHDPILDGEDDNIVYVYDLTEEEMASMFS